MTRHRGELVGPRRLRRNAEHEGAATVPAPRLEVPCLAQASESLADRHLGHVELAREPSLAREPVPDVEQPEADGLGQPARDLIGDAVPVRQRTEDDRAGSIAPVGGSLVPTDDENRARVEPCLDHRAPVRTRTGIDL